MFMIISGKGLEASIITETSDRGKAFELYEEVKKVEADIKKEGKESNVVKLCQIIAHSGG